jgi:light-regulated signal transduction histidine kinase (bacteriophytochrome)
MKHADARRVADGDLDPEVDLGGQQEVRSVDVNANRMRELSEVQVRAQELERSNAELQRSNAELRRSNAELGQFAYEAAHELQEPLRKVAGFCQLLQLQYSGQLDATANEYIDYAVDGAIRMQALITSLLALSRVGRNDRDLARVSCASALSEAMATLSSAIHDAGVVIETTELPSVRAEFALLTSMFRNLLSNAIRFRGHRPPVVRVSVERQDDGFWQFSVADNGIGVAAEYAERIFGIFQRLDNRATRPGAGIGLAMCRGIVEFFGGRIWLDTDYQDGARFVFTLPIAPAEDEEVLA